MSKFGLILFLFIIIINIFPLGDSSKFMDKNKTNNMKVILQFIVIFHHLSQNTSQYQFLNYFRHAGMYAVGGFFFISIYGMSRQLIKNKQYYIDKFLEKRFLKLFLSIFIFSIIVILLRIIFLNETFSLSSIIKIYLSFSTPIPNGWYLNSILVIYLLFYISFKFTNNLRLGYGIFTILIIIYIELLKYFNFGLWNYNSMYSIFLAIIFINFEEKIVKFIYSNYRLLLIISASIFYLLNRYGYSFWYEKRIDISMYILQNIMTISFVILFLLIFNKINLSNKIIKFFSQITFEMYMLHGILMRILDVYLPTNILYIALLFILTTVFSFVLNKFFNKINTILIK